MESACRRISQRLVTGKSLPMAVSGEPEYFDQKAVKLLEVGYKSGAVVKIIDRLAADEEEHWKLTNDLKSNLAYPVGIACLATIATVVLPPLVLAELLTQIVKLTEEPPVLTKILISLSNALSSPWTLLAASLLLIFIIWMVRTGHWEKLCQRLEPYAWEIPAVGELWRDIIAVRFLSVFSLTYKSGLPATQCMVLSASATGSPLVASKGDLMKRRLIDGGTLRECFEMGDFLPGLALEAVEAGQQVGEIPAMLDCSARTIKTVVRTRIDAVTKLIEPLVLAVIGVFVGIFALGCLLPIIRLAETL